MCDLSSNCEKGILKTGTRVKLTDLKIGLKLTAGEGGPLSQCSVEGNLGLQERAGSHFFHGPEDYAIKTIFLVLIERNYYLTCHRIATVI